MLAMENAACGHSRTHDAAHSSGRECTQLELKDAISQTIESNDLRAILGIPDCAH